MDGKSILFENLPPDPQIQTKIIIDTFERFYRIPKSTFSQDGGRQKDRVDALKVKKKKVEEMKRALYKKYYPLLDTKDLCQELMQLDIKKKKNFMERWNKGRLEKCLGKQSDTDFGVKQLVQGLIDFHEKEGDVSNQMWDQIKEKSKETEAELKKNYGPVIEIKDLVQIQLDAKDLDEFNQGWRTLKDMGTGILPLEFDIGTVAEHLEQAESTRLKDHVIWIKYSTVVLQNLAKDISLVKSVNADGWNHTILKEVIHLILFIEAIFKDLIDGLLTLPKHVSSEFTAAMDSVEGGYGKLLNHLQNNDDDIVDQIIEDAEKTDGGKVSAKTIRELYIINQLSQKVLDGRLKVIGNLDIQILKSNIKIELTKLQVKLRDEKLLVFKEYSEWSEKKKNNLELAWAPNMIAVVLDLHTGFLLTGATQPACKDHFLLREAARKIPHIQVGREYECRIADCNNDWKNKKCKEWRRKWSEELKELEKSGKEEFSRKEPERSKKELKDLFEGEKPEVYGRLPASGEDERIMCWALTGHTFEFQSPCPRCAYFYPSWDLYKTGDFSNPAHVISYLHSGMANTREENEFHCAETVAAAQIYASRHETLGFGC